MTKNSLMRFVNINPPSKTKQTSKKTNTKTHSQTKVMQKKCLGK